MHYLVVATESTPSLRHKTLQYQLSVLGELGVHNGNKSSIDVRESGRGCLGLEAGAGKQTTGPSVTIEDTNAILNKIRYLLDQSRGGYQPSANEIFLKNFRNDVFQVAHVDFVNNTVETFLECIPSSSCKNVILSNFFSSTLILDAAFVGHFLLHHSQTSWGNICATSNSEKLKPPNDLTPALVNDKSVSLDLEIGLEAAGLAEEDASFISAADFVSFAGLKPLKLLSRGEENRFSSSILDCGLLLGDATCSDSLALPTVKRQASLGTPPVRGIHLVLAKLSYTG